MEAGLHFLLTYMCNLECAHCFTYSGPYAKGTFTLDQIHKVLKEACKVETIDTIYFEGGEPFLFYPLMLEGIKLARSMNFNAGIVTNGYFATSMENAELWLKPLKELGLFKLSISNDLYHYENQEENPAKLLLAAGEKLGIQVNLMSTEKPRVEKGKIHGNTLFRGRAVEKMINNLPGKSWKELIECPYEDLSNPSRVHLDVYGNVHLCQGLSMGNMWQTPLSKLIKNYNADSHPIARPLANEGPAGLAKEFNLKHADKYVDECHFCYSLRMSLMDKFPQYLGPRQIYGLE